MGVLVGEGVLRVVCALVVDVVLVVADTALVVATTSGLDSSVKGGVNGGRMGRGGSPHTSSTTLFMACSKPV